MAEVTDPQRDFSSALLSQYRGRTLRRGARSKTTRALQLFLKEKGYDIAADGVYGPQTEKAVRAYQKENGLNADGQAGKRTLTKMRESITPRPRERPTAIPRGDFTSPMADEAETVDNAAEETIETPPALPPDFGAGAGAVRPPPSFEPDAVMSAGIGGGGPPPIPPVASAGPPPVSSVPPPGPTLPPPPPDAPTALPAPPMAGPPPTDPSVWAGKFTQPPPMLPPPPIPENYTSALDQAADQGQAVPPTQLIDKPDMMKALAAGTAGPGPQIPTGPQSAGPQLTPEQMAMIQALMQQGGARGGPPGQAGY